jgi:hypothetical protein
MKISLVLVPLIGLKKRNGDKDLLYKAVTLTAE